MEKILEDFVKNNNPLPPIQQPQITGKEYIKGCMGNDPMSPYKIPSSQLVYKDIVDVINKKPFSAMFPQSYTPISNYFLENSISPYFNPMEHEDFATGKITISGMIDLACNGQPWVLLRDQDFNEIIHLTESYIDQVSDLDINQKYKMQISRMKIFLNMMYKGRARMCKRRGILNTGREALTNILKKLVR